MKLKSLLMIGVLILGMVSCTGAQKSTVGNLFADLTVEAVTKDCTAVERWTLHVMGVPSMVVLFKDCGNVENLLMVLAPDIRDNKILTNTVVNLVYLSYVDFVNEKESWTGKPIKKYMTPIGEGKDQLNSHVAFFSLKRTKENK